MLNEGLTRRIAQQIRDHNITITDKSPAGLRHFLNAWKRKDDYRGRPVNKHLNVAAIDLELLSELLKEAFGRDNKLDVGDKVRIVGFVMLKGLNNGECYEIVALHPSARAYILRKLTEGGKLDKRSGTIGFYYRQIDGWLDTDNANRIERI